MASLWVKVTQYLLDYSGVLKRKISSLPPSAIVNNSFTAVFILPETILSFTPKLTLPVRTRKQLSFSHLFLTPSDNYEIVNTNSQKRRESENKKRIRKKGRKWIKTHISSQVFKHLLPAIVTVRAMEIYDVSLSLLSPVRESDHYVTQLFACGGALSVSLYWSSASTSQGQRLLLCSGSLLSGKCSPQVTVLFCVHLSPSLIYIFIGIFFKSYGSDIRILPRHFRGNLRNFRNGNTVLDQPWWRNTFQES